MRLKLELLFMFVGLVLNFLVNAVILSVIHRIVTFAVF